MSGHACDVCDPSVGVSESNPQPGIYVFTCCGCGRELWQEHEDVDPYGDFPNAEEGDK